MNEYLNENDTGEIVVPQEVLDALPAAIDDIERQTERIVEQQQYEQQRDAQQAPSTPQQPMGATVTMEPMPIEVQAEVPAPAQPSEMYSPPPMREQDAKPPNLLQTVFDALAAPGQGLNDYFIDEMNKIPGRNWKKRSPYQNEMIQSARELSSFILPNVLMGRMGSKVANRAIKPRLPAKLQNSTALKVLGETSLNFGTGAWVDATNKLNEKDDNFLGSLKKSWPQTYAWVPEDWATLDSDSPDVKKMKNITEGGYFSVFGDLLVGGSKLVRSLFKTKKVSKFIAKDQSAQALFDKINKGEMDAEDAVIDAAKQREDAFEELQAYMSEFDETPEVPKLGNNNEIFNVDEGGIRSVDPGGVYGAAVDAAKIQNNIGTVHGRLGSIVSDPALKYGLAPDNLEGRVLIKGITEAIKEGGDYDYKGIAGTITAKQRDEAAEALSEAMMDPRMDKGELKKTLDNFRDTINTMEGTVRPINQLAYEAVFKSIRKYMDEFMNMDTIKAQAYLTTSMAGQVSDMAEGVRHLEGDNAVSRVQEMILDRMEYLLVEKGLASYQRGAGLANLKLWEQARRLVEKDPKKLLEISENARARTQDALRDLIPRAKTTVEELRRINDLNPEFLKPLMLAWEFSDGSVDTMGKLNDFMHQSLSKVTKAFQDNHPEIPNVLVQGMWSNIYNSYLTSFGTPSKAVMGNAALMLAKPVSVFAGAAGRFVLGDGDAALKTIKRGWYQYSAVVDTFQKGAKHMGHVFRKASMDPTSVSYIMRPDIAIAQDNQMDALFSIAEAYSKDGNDGPMVLWQHANELRNLSNNPVLRFGANAMSAMDGFTRAVEANVQARGRAWDKFIDGDVPLNGLTYKDASDNIYADMFGKDGLINDESVDYASKEIALSLDNAGAQALGAFIARNPAIKPFLLFPKTSANVVSLFDKFSPVSLFQREYNDLAFKKLDEFTSDEMMQLLRQHKKPVDGNLFQEFASLRAEVLGRKAIGTTAVMMAAGLFLTDRIHGNGHYDKTVQRSRREFDWAPRSIKGLDGKWYSYDGLGPISDWLALTADVMDNFDSLGEMDLQGFMNRAGFLLSANLTNKSMLAPMEPMFDVLSGNPAAITRFAASFASATLPLSNARSEFSRLMSPALREFEETFANHLRNRNRFLDEFGVPGELAKKYDWIDGKLVGYPQDIMTRLWNAVAPFKIRDGISPEKQYLIDIEYDARAQFTSSSDGARYTDTERAELLSLMGEQKNFLRDLKTIMQKYPADEWKRGLFEARKKNPAGGVDPKQWGNLYNELDLALLNAKRMAESELSNRIEVDSRSYQRDVNITSQRASQVPPFPLTNK